MADESTSTDTMTSDLAKETYPTIRDVLSTATDDWARINLSMLTRYMAARVSATAFSASCSATTRTGLTSPMRTINIMSAKQQMKLMDSCLQESQRLHPMDSRNDFPRFFIFVPLDPAAVMDVDPFTNTARSLNYDPRNGEPKISSMVENEFIPDVS